MQQRGASVSAGFQKAIFRVVEDEASLAHRQAHLLLMLGVTLLGHVIQLHSQQSAIYKIPKTRNQRVRQTYNAARLRVGEVIRVLVHHPPGQTLCVEIEPTHQNLQQRFKPPSPCQTMYLSTLTVPQMDQ